MADTESRRLWYERDPSIAYLQMLYGAAKAGGAAANATVNGAYSTLDNTYDAGRAVARGIGVLGPEEFRRFGQEADFIGASLGPVLGQVGPALGQIAKHPGPAARAAYHVWKKEPLLPFYLAGRAGMGAITGLGPAAIAGGALRAVEDGHNLVDAIVYPGVLGRPLPPGGLLGVPPEGRGLLGIPPQDAR
jgi:hypothetical protein